MVFSKIVFVAATKFRISESCKDDWYVPRTNTFKRKHLLTLVFITKDLIRQMNKGEYILKPAFDNASMQVKSTGSKFVNDLDKFDWQKIRFVLKSMVRKYQKEANHERFDEYVNLSRTLWKYSLANQ